MCRMKTVEKPRRVQLMELVGALSLLWSLSLEESRCPEEDYSFFEEASTI